MTRHNSDNVIGVQQVIDVGSIEYDVVYSPRLSVCRIVQRTVRTDRYAEQHPGDQQQTPYQSQYE